VGYLIVRSGGGAEIGEAKIEGQRMHRNGVAIARVDRLEGEQETFVWVSRANGDCVRLPLAEIVVKEITA
jgi:hypothetical protein